MSKTSDLFYFEDLIFFLKKDQGLRDHFTERDFFVTPKIEPSDIEKEAKCDSPLDRGLWVYPGATTSNTKKTTQCGFKGIHTFYITVLLRCTRNRFEITEKDGVLKLGGPVMKATCIRAELKNAIKRFNNKTKKTMPPPRYTFINWEKDEMIEVIDEGCGMINATMVFSLELI